MRILKPTRSTVSLTQLTSGQAFGLNVYIKTVGVAVDGCIECVDLEDGTTPFFPEDIQVELIKATLHVEGY